MSDVPIISLPISSIIEIRNSQGDYFVASPEKAEAYFVELRRVGGCRRRQSVVLYRDIAGDSELKEALEMFLVGNYEDFKEKIFEPPSKKQFALQLVIQFVAMALGLSFLAFIVSVFLKGWE